MVQRAQVLLFCGADSVKPPCLYRLLWLITSTTTTYCRKLHKMAAITPRPNPGALLSCVAVRGKGRGLMHQALKLIAIGLQACALQIAPRPEQGAKAKKSCKTGSSLCTSEIRPVMA